MNNFGGGGGGNFGGPGGGYGWRGGRGGGGDGGFNGGPGFGGGGANFQQVGGGFNQGGGFGNVPPPQNYGRPFRGGRGRGGGGLRMNNGGARGKRGGGRGNFQQGGFMGGNMNMGMGGMGNMNMGGMDNMMMGPIGNMGGMGPMGGPNQPMNNPNVSPADVLSWLDHAPPFALRRILAHVRWLLEQQEEPEEEPIVDIMNMGEDEDDESDEDDEDDAVEGAPEMMALPPDEMGMFADEASSVQMNRGVLGQTEPPAKKKRGGAKKHLGLGFQNMMPGAAAPALPSQWTPGGWTAKNNSHKVTTAVRPLPPADILPPPTDQATSSDRDKLKILNNNLTMMNFEMNKICRKMRIQNFDISNLSSFEEGQQEKLKTAHTCVTAAEKTLNEYKQYLVEVKYKDWNEEQKRIREEHMKKMIGEMPTGVPFRKPYAAAQEEEYDEYYEEEEQHQPTPAPHTTPSKLMGFTKGEDLKVEKKADEGEEDDWPKRLDEETTEEKVTEEKEQNSEEQKDVKPEEQKAEVEEQSREEEEEEERPPGVSS